ncbi:MAG TPA: sensor domain-containing diguanylate cyclase [Longimicrobium sp.]|nr:sensor domain-containing diguanylate cyclase [Longimicrobium sp.]
MRLRRHGGEHRQRLRRGGGRVAHQPPPGVLTIPRPGRSSDLPVPLLAAGAAYLAALALLGVLPRSAAWVVLVLLVALAAWTWRERRRKHEAALAAWPPLHLLLYLTGSLASPLLPLAAGWVVVTGRVAPRLAAAASLLALVSVPLAEWLHLAPPSLVSLLRHFLLVALAGALVVSPRGRVAKAEKPAREAPPPARKGERASDGQVWEEALELARRATDAHEAALWRADAEWTSAALLARTASPEVPAPAPVVALEGTPYRWAVEENLPQHVQRGRRDLPVPWAAEMLLVPVDLPEGVLALSYPSIVPPGAQATALEAGRHLSALAQLLRLRGESERAEHRATALAEAAATLPGELELDAFARNLASLARRGAGAAGSAVAIGMDEAGRGKVVHVDDTGPSPRFAADGFGEGESRVALVLKHPVVLAYDDLRRERDRLPLCTPGEQWAALPRSAAVFPLEADGRALGAVIVWHAEPGRFGEKETEFLKRLCAIAPLPLRSLRKYEALDHRAHTDALTALPNRAAFEERLAALSNVFDRYGRAFGVLVADVDFFKKFNDTHGHDVGDRVLQHVAQLLKLTVRDVDLPARLGGEEFVVLFPETGLRASAEAAERIRRAIEARPLMVNGRALPVTVSIGVAACPDCTPIPGDLLKLADEALYRAKSAGRNRVSLAARVGKPEAGV